MVLDTYLAVEQAHVQSFSFGLIPFAYHVTVLVHTVYRLCNKMMILMMM